MEKENRTLSSERCDNIIIPYVNKLSYFYCVTLDYLLIFYLVQYPRVIFIYVILYEYYFFEVNSLSVIKAVHVTS